MAVDTQDQFYKLLDKVRDTQREYGECVAANNITRMQALSKAAYLALEDLIQHVEPILIAHDNHNRSYLEMFELMSNAEVNEKK